MIKLRIRLALYTAFAVLLLALTLFATGSVRAQGVDSVAKKRLAVLPWKVNAPGSMDFLSGALSEMLTSRLGSAEGVTIVRSDRLKGALGSLGSGSDIDPVAAGVGKKLGLDYVLYGSITLLGESVSLDAKLLDVKEAKVGTYFSSGRGLDSVVSMADTVAGRVNGSIFPKAALPAATAAEAPKSVVPLSPQVLQAPSTPVTGALLEPVLSTAVKGGEKFWKGPFMKGLYSAMVATDLDRDGVKELFLLKESSVTVAAVSEGRLETIAELHSGEGIQLVAIDAIDTDRDGVPEVYVSGVRDSSADSFTIEFDGSEYGVALKRLRRLFKVIDYDGRSLLVGQGYREADGFYGELRRYEKEGAGLVDKGRFEAGLPDDLNIYRFTLISSVAGEQMLAALNHRNRLVLYTRTGTKGWQREWKSSEYYGGTLNYVETVNDESDDSFSTVVPVEGRFFYVDIDSNGSKELIIKTGSPGGLGRYADVVRSYKDGTVLSLSWDGQFLNEQWRTKKVSGHIADFFVEHADGGAVMLWMLVNEGGGALFGKPKSYVLSYQLPL